MYNVDPNLRSLPAAQPGWLRRAVLLSDHPWLSALLAFMGYTLAAALYRSIWSPSHFPYFNYLADAFLHGQLALRLVPPATHDLIVYGGELYMYWPPMPAVLLMPLVALFGVHVSDVLFTLVLAALNVALVALLLREAGRRQIVALSPLQRSLLVLFFAFGTVHMTLAPYGRVWFTAQIVDFTFVALGYLAALRLRGGWAFGLSGLAFACALLTRNHTLLAGIWPALYLLDQHRSAGRWRLARYVALGLLPVLLALGLLALYNWLRFGSALDNGIAYHRMAAVFLANFQRYGAFDLYYVPKNLYYQYIFYPFPLTREALEGGSLFLLSPLFFAAFWGLALGRPRWLAWALLATIVLVAVPILLVMGTGWVQFGPRYTLDFTVPLLLLTALGIRRWPVWLVSLLLMVSIVHYLLGTYYLAVRN